MLKQQAPLAVQTTVGEGLQGLVAAPPVCVSGANVDTSISNRSDPSPPSQSAWLLGKRANPKEPSPTPLVCLFFSFLTGRGEHYLISFFGCTILEEGDNGWLEIHVSDSHIRHQLNPFFLLPPLVCPTPAFLSPCKISIKPPPPTAASEPQRRGRKFQPS